MKKRKAPNAHGLNPKTFPVSVRGFVDQDYIQLLSKEDKAWLAKFNDGWHGADFRNDLSPRTPAAKRRERYRAKNAANRDLTAYYAAGNLLDNVDDLSLLAHTQDLITSTPAVLDDPDYKAALVDLRKAIDTKPRSERAVCRAQAKIRAILNK